MVTLAVAMTRWLQFWDHVLTSFPPKAHRAWESDALPSLSRHDEHTTSSWWCTLWMAVTVIQNATGFEWMKFILTVSCIQNFWAWANKTVRASKGKDTLSYINKTTVLWLCLVSVTHLNLLSKTPNVTVSSDCRFTAVSTVKRWLLTNVPYLEESFKVRV